MFVREDLSLESLATPLSERQILYCAVELCMNMVILLYELFYMLCDE